MPIRWKVVTHRRQSIMVWDTGFAKYYQEGSIVKANPSALGLMTFEKKKYAQDFASLEAGIGRSLTLKVRGIGRGVRPKKISRKISQLGLDGWYRDVLNIGTVPPPGTICYRSVEVLE